MNSKDLYKPYTSFGPYGPIRKDQNFDIQQQPNITSILKGIEKENANLEAERGELAVKPDLSGIYRIGGKTHAKGGTPLNLQAGSFIFSNDKKLHVNPYEKEIFEFKEGGVTGKKENTPAKVLAREIDIKHYNSSANILNDKSETGYDTISKNSAALMLQKYQEKIGQVAFVQEAKKGFPTGVPDFSQGTAPLYNPQTKEEIEQVPQYMQFGGFNGGTSSGGGAGSSFHVNNKDYDAFGVGQYFKRKHPQFVGDQFPDVREYLNGKPVDSIYTRPKNYQWDKWPDLPTGQTQQEQDQMPDEYPDHSHIPYGAPLPQTQRGRSGPAAVPAPGININALRPGLSSVPKMEAQDYIKTQVGVPVNNKNPLSSNQFEQSSSLPYDPKVPLSPLQKANLLYSGYQALTVPRYSPQRMNVSSSQVELERYNPQAALNSVDNSAYQAYQSNRVSNPYLAGNNNAAIFGKALEARQQVIGDYANRNVGIANQQNLTNNQIQRGDLQFNTQANNTYYNQTQAVAQNYDNERRFARNQTVSLFNDYQNKNQELEQFLGSQRNAGKVQVGTNKDGSPIYKSMPLYGYDNSGFRPRVYYTGAGSLDSLPDQGSKSSDLEKVLDILKSRNIDPNTPAGSRILNAALGKGQFSSQYPIQKKGGKVKPNPYY